MLVARDSWSHSAARTTACGGYGPRLSPGRRKLLHPSLRRRGGGIHHVVDLLAPAQNLGGQHGVIEALQVEVVDRLALDPLLDHAVDAAAHHDLAGLGLVTQAGGEVGDAADRSIFQALLKTDLAERGIA